MGALADMGMFSITIEIGATSGVSVYEPGQKAIIAWNDGKEIMLLSTDVNASKETKAIRILPLSSEPTIQTGSFKSFETVQRLIDEHAPRVEIESTGLMTLGGPLGSTVSETQGVEILFHKRMGAHDITVAKANDYTGFVEWARGFIGEAGFNLSSRTEPVIRLNRPGIAGDFNS